MPDRLIRDELLESERWLALPDNTARVCYLALLLNADAFGNMDAGAGRLRRLWRDYGPESPDDIARMVITLAKVDLIREYAADGKPYLHIPRYRQNLRYTKQTYPQDPWSQKERKTEQQNEKNQPHKNNSHGAHTAHTQSTPRAHSRSEVKGSEVKGSDSAREAQPVDNSNARRPKPDPHSAAPSTSTPKGNGDDGRPQWRNPAWVAATAKLLDVKPHIGEHDDAFRDRVHAALQAKLRRPIGSDPQ